MYLDKKIKIKIKKKKCMSPQESGVVNVMDTSVKKRAAASTNTNPVSKATIEVNS